METQSREMVMTPPSQQFWVRPRLGKPHTHPPQDTFLEWVQGYREEAGLAQELRWESAGPERLR